jgi:carbohydrate kinase (thermoresistant glucokinase family)
VTRPRILIVMGVSGSGKSTVAGALAERLGWALAEGDDFHPPGNIAKMHAGTPLTDADRFPWLKSIVGWIDTRLKAGQSGIVTCSALKRAYRDLLSKGRPEILFVYLKGSPAVMAKHLAGRQGHFMPASLLASQFDTLEEPGSDEPVLTVNDDQPVEAIVDEIVRDLGSARREIRPYPKRPVT